MKPAPDGPVTELYRRESSVGDFLLGMPAPGSAVPAEPGEERHAVNSPEWELSAALNEKPGAGETSSGP